MEVEEEVDADTAAATAAAAETCEGVGPFEDAVRDGVVGVVEGVGAGV